MKKTTSGFTIVELLVVIVVIGILAAITIVAFNGIQDRARTAKINSDLSALNKAVQIARTFEGKLMTEITGSIWTSETCEALPSGSDLSNKTLASDCWADYAQTLDLLTTASGVNVKGLVDPWGRPYFIDENEEYDMCKRDQLGIYSRPFVTGWSPQEKLVEVPFYRTDC